MMRTVSRLFDDHAEAVAAVRDLEAAGFGHKDISLISGERAAREHRSFDPEHPDNVHASQGLGAGAAIGAGVGGGASLIAGLGLLAIPGMGPVLGAGFLVSALAGAAAGAMTGGMIGALQDDAGLSESEAHTVAETVRRGGSVVSVKAPDDRRFHAEEILIRHGGVDEPTRRQAFTDNGWSGFQDTH